MMGRLKTLTGLAIQGQPRPPMGNKVLAIVPSQNVSKTWLQLLCLLEITNDCAEVLVLTHAFQINDDVTMFYFERMESDLMYAQSSIVFADHGDCSLRKSESGTRGAEAVSG